MAVAVGLKDEATLACVRLATEARRSREYAQFKRHIETRRSDILLGLCTTGVRFGRRRVVHLGIYMTDVMYG